MAKAPVADICDRLADVFFGIMPLPGQEPRGRKAPRAGDTEAELQRFYAAAGREREAHRLGVIGQARVALGIQQRLLDKGYPAPLVKQVLFAMLLSAFVGQKK